MASNVRPTPPSIASAELNQLAAAANVSLLGSVGGAGGRALRDRICMPQELRACAIEAVQACRTMRSCTTAEVQMIDRPYCKGCMYTLRAAYTSWTPQMMLPRTPATLRIRARLCAKIASRAAQVAVGLTLTKGDQQGWRRFFCEEYVASPGWPVPPFGPSAPAAPLPGATGRVHCPAPTPTLQIYAYSNRPGPWLCAFLRTAAFAGAPVTVVGWEPQGFERVRHRLKLLATMFCCICHRTPRRSRTRCGTRSTSYTHG